MRPNLRYSAGNKMAPRLNEEVHSRRNEQRGGKDGATSLSVGRRGTRKPSSKKGAKNRISEQGKFGRAMANPL